MNAFIRHTLITAAALCCLSAQSAWASTESTIKEGREAAEQYKESANKECSPLSGNAQDVCEAKVNVLYTRMDSMLKAEGKGTFKAYYDAKIDIAKAEHKLAKEKCDDLKGNPKDVCLKDAKVAFVKAEEDAKTAIKVHKAKTDAAEEKMDAMYAAAKERCDAYSGPEKDSCVDKAKVTFKR